MKKTTISLILFFVLFVISGSLVSASADIFPVQIGDKASKVSLALVPTPVQASILTVEYEALMSDELKAEGYVYETLLQNTMDIITRRLSDKGFTEATVSKLGTSGIRVEIPGVTDPTAVLDLISSPARLEFLDYNGNVFLEGRHLKTAASTVDEDGQPAISFSLTNEGAQIFGDTTVKNIGKRITIQLDGVEMMSPMVNSAIYGGNIQISGSFTKDQADTIALQLQSGSLPLNLRQDQLDIVSAFLGVEDAVKSNTIPAHDEDISQTVIIDVAGKTFVKAEVQQAINNAMDYQEYLYSYYGIKYDRTDADTIALAQDTAINELIEEAVTDQKLQERGLDQFTDEEMAVINKTVDETYTCYVSAVTSYYFADVELTGENLDAAVKAKMVELGYGSRESLLEQLKRTASIDKLKEMVSKDICVAEDEIVSQYDSNVTSAITTYTAYLTQYASDVNSGAIIYFVPPGYRYVKNLLIKISDEENTAIQSISSQIFDKQDSLNATRAAIVELPENQAEDDEYQAKSREGLTEQVDALNADIQTLTAQLDALTETAYNAIQSTVNEVQAKIGAGKDFDALIMVYGEDLGMIVEPQKSLGYLICDGLTDYADEFLKASMALKNVGDISAPFRSNSGIHIVLYASNLQDGQVELSAIHDQIAAELLVNKQNAMYDETVSQWIADANADIYLDRLDYKGTGD